MRKKKRGGSRVFLIRSRRGGAFRAKYKEESKGLKSVNAEKLLLHYIRAYVIMLAYEGKKSDDFNFDCGDTCGAFGRLRGDGGRSRRS